MGNESSTPVAEDVPPVTLYARTIEAVADYIKKGNAKRIVVMTGAGISTSAGIPDFRSPETGLYANLARLDLPFAEAVFDISYFRNNPRPFYELAHELYPGKYRPTITHSFISLLNKKGLLLKAFTQNIDCLEREAGVPADKIVEAHGSFATQRCIDCGLEFSDENMKTAIKIKEVPYCERTRCGGLVKPDIVFFGEALPESFHLNRALPAQADLAIVMGTSLSVQPFASLPSFVREETPRVLINMDRVGGLGSRPDDVLLLGDCDEGVRKFADALGWRDELEALWESTNPDKGERKKQEVPPKDKQTELNDKIEELTKSVDKTLKLSDEHLKQFEKDFENPSDARNLNVPGEADGTTTTEAENQTQSKEKATETNSQAAAPNPVYNVLSEASGTATEAENQRQNEEKAMESNSQAVAPNPVYNVLSEASGTATEAENRKQNEEKAMEINSQAAGLSHVYPHLSRKASEKASL